MILSLAIGVLGSKINIQEVVCFAETLRAPLNGLLFYSTQLFGLGIVG